MDKLNGLRLRQLPKNEEMHYLYAKDLIHDTAHLFPQTWDPPCVARGRLLLSTGFVLKK